MDTALPIVLLVTVGLLLNLLLEAPWARYPEDLDTAVTTGGNSSESLSRMVTEQEGRHAMIKTIVMVVGLAAFTGASVACFGLFSSNDRPVREPCEGLSGQTKTDCEQGKSSRPR